jgi:hypothetical protein
MRQTADPVLRGSALWSSLSLQRSLPGAPNELTSRTGTAGSFHLCTRFPYEFRNVQLRDRCERGRFRAELQNE